MLEYVETLKKEFGDAELTVKALRDKIKELRDTILNAEVGTEDYNKAVQNLQNAQRTLNEVMSLTDKNTLKTGGSYVTLAKNLRNYEEQLRKAKAEGKDTSDITKSIEVIKEQLETTERSYKDLTEVMSMFKKEWRETTDMAVRNDLSEQINSINNELKELDAETGNYQRNVGNYTNSIVDAYKILKQEIKQAQAEVLNAEEGTEEYAKAMANLADAQFRMRDMTEQSRYAVNDLGEQLSNVNGIMSGLISGFGAVQGAMNLLGADTEDFEKTMVKLQSTIALVQGMQGLEGLGDRFKGLASSIKIATKSIGTAGWLGILVAVGSAIAVVVSNLQKKRKEVEDGTKAIKDFNNAYEDQIATYSKEITELQLLNEFATDNNLITEQRIGFADKLVEKLGLENTEINRQKALNGELKTSIEDVIKAYQKQVLAKVALEQIEEKVKEQLRLQQEIKKLEDKGQVGLLERMFLGSDGNGMDRRLPKLRKELGNINNDITTITETAKAMGADFSSALGLVDEEIVDTNDDLSTLQSNINHYFEVLKRNKKLEGATEIELLKVDKSKIKEELKALKDALEKTDDVKLKQEIKQQIEIKEIELKEIEQSIVEKTKNSIETEIKSKFDNQTTELDFEYEVKIRKAILNGADEGDIFQLGLDRLTEELDLMQTEYNKLAEKGFDTTEIARKIALKEIEIEEYKNAEVERLRQEDAENNKKALDEKVKAEEEYKQKRDAIMFASLNATASIIGSIADMYEQDKENLKENEKKIKALRIVESTISTITGAINAYNSAQTLPPPANFIVGAINATTVLATGMANIAKIRNTQISDTDSSGGDVGGASFTSSVPQADLYEGQTFNYTRNITGEREIENLNKDQRVYILESDLQESNRRVQVRETETSF